MKKIIFLLAFLCLAMPLLHAQYNTNQNKVWAFGWNGGVDFTSGGPVGVPTSILTAEGCASVSSATGQLLFYTDGDTVFNRTGAKMPSGAGITGFPISTSSTTQAAQIIPVISNPNQYYLFSLESYLYAGPGSKLKYSIVDMSLAGGLGDVVSSSAGTLLGDYMGERMTAVKGNNCNVWLIVHRQDSAVFLVYNVTASGISAPVVSNVGTFTTAGYSIGHLKVSPDRTKLVSVTYNGLFTSGGGLGTELYDFDANTGIVSNCRVLDATNYVYGAEFSADNTKLYTCYTSTGLANPTYLVQYDVTLGTAAAISASEYTVFTSNYYQGVYPELKLGPNDKIYLPSMDTIETNFLDCIANPNASGAACGYTPKAVTLAPNTYAVFGLPNVFFSVLDTTIKRHDTTLCASVGGITLNATPGYTYYSWNTGAATSSITVTTSGTYVSYAVLDCHLLIDTIRVNLMPFGNTSSVIDTSFCYPGTFTLVAPNGYTSYVWQDGSTSNTYSGNTGGTYFYIGVKDCGQHTDTFHVTPKTLEVSLGPDTTVCMNYMILPQIRGDSVSYLWQDGSRSNYYSASHTGTYYVTVHQGSCYATDSMNVTFFHYTQNIRDTFICKGEPINVTVSCTVPIGGSVMWNDGITNPTRVIKDSGTWWVFVSKDECMILDTVRVETGYCKCWQNIPEAFTPNNDGLNDVFVPRIEPGCSVSGYQLNIYNRWGELVFSSDFKDKGWDGTFKGIPADMGVYMYSLQFFVGEKVIPVVKNGNVTLVR